MSNLIRLRYASRAGRSRKRSPAHGGMSKFIYRRLCCTLLYQTRCESRACGATHKVYKIRREIPQRVTKRPLGFRWGFDNASNSSTNGQHRLSNVKTKRLAVLEKPQRCKPEAVNVFLYGVASRNHAFFVLKIYGDEMQWVQP
jgi:hypothetical protein